MALPSATLSARIAAVCSLLLLLRAALADLRTMRLPNWLIGSAVVCAALANVLAGTTNTMLIAAGFGAAPFLLIHLIDPKSLGFGDVKFAAAAGLLVATWWWPAALAMSVATLIVVCLVRHGRPRGALPMGPALFVGTCLAVGLSIVLAQKGLIL
ncbi:MAG: prepilin peptidase [Actinomycetota bacterium]